MTEFHQDYLEGYVGDYIPSKILWVLFVIQNNQFSNLIKYFEVSIVQHQNSITVHNTIQSVGNGNYGTVYKFFPNGLLNEVICPANVLRNSIHIMKPSDFIFVVMSEYFTVDPH